MKRVDAAGARRRPRWLWPAVAVMVIVIVIVGAVGFALRAPSSAPPSSAEDCATVEDVARQWNTMSAAVRDTLLNGGGQPAEYRSVADRQLEMAETLRSAADSVSSPQIRQHLGEWADGATEYAALQRSVADRAPGTPPPPQADADFERVARSMNDAAGALRGSCPQMPPAEQ